MADLGDLRALDLAARLLSSISTASAGWLPMDARHQRRWSCRKAAYLLATIVIIVETAASSCPPPEEQSLADVHCPRQTHRTQEDLDLCYMKARMAAHPTPLPRSVL